jgi:predicted nucleic acid-binding protein
MKVYLETSSLVKLYRSEQESDDVISLLESFLDRRIELSTSAISRLELVRGLTKGGVNEVTISKVEADLEMYAARGLNMLPVSEEILECAIPYIKKNHLGAIDALHLASALMFADVLITNDDHLLKSSLKKDIKNSLRIIKPSQVNF